MDQPLLSEWMRRQRALRDLTQEALAEEVGCAVQTVRAFENGWRRPSRPLAERLAAVLGIPAEQRAAFMHAARAPLARGAPAPTPPAADHAAYLAAIAERARAELYGPDQQRWLDRLDVELGEIRAALAWALAEGGPDLAGRVELALRAASAIERFWHGRGHHAEGQGWLERGIGLADRAGLAVDPAALAAALGSAGWLANIRGERARAMALLQRCVALSRTLGDGQGTSDALDSLGDIAIFEGDAMAAAWFYEESLALRRGLGRPAQVALSLNGLGHAAVLRGYYERAVGYFQESLTILRDLGDRRSTAMALHGAGLARLRQGDLAQAAPQLGAALELFHTLDSSLDTALCLELIGELLALRVLTAGADADLAGEAARLWGASEAMLADYAITLSPTEQARRAALIAAARLRLGAGPFRARWDEGRGLAAGAAVMAGLQAVRWSGPPR